MDNNDNFSVSLLANPLALDGGQGAATFQMFGTGEASVSPAMLVVPLRIWLRLRLAFVAASFTREKDRGRHRAGDRIRKRGSV